MASMSASAASLSSALSSMEVMLDALMQRGIGKPEDKPKDLPPPRLPSRPTVRGRPPSLHRTSTPSPWVSVPLLPPIQPPQEDDEEEEHGEGRFAHNLALERRAIKAEQEARQREEVVRRKEEEIAELRHQVEHYESQLSECELKMRSVEEELQKQIASLQQMNAGSRAGTTGGSTRTSHHRRDSSASATATATPARPPLPRHSVSAAAVQKLNESPETQAAQTELDRLAGEFMRESQAFAQGAKAAAAASSVDELRRLKRQFTSWKKDYSGRLRKANAELVRRQLQEKGHDPAAGSWWKFKLRPATSKPGKLPSPVSCCCCFTRGR